MKNIIKLMDLLQEKAKLGSGARFKAVEKNAAEHGASDPAAVAAAAGMKKYGKAKMEKMAHAHENTEIVKEDGLSTVKKTNPGPATSMTTYERDANGIRQTTGSKTVDKEAQRKKYDKYINPPNRVETKHTLMKNLVEYDLDDDAVENDNGPGQQLPEGTEPEGFDSMDDMDAEMSKRVADQNIHYRGGQQQKGPAPASEMSWAAEKKAGLRNKPKG